MAGQVDFWKDDIRHKLVEIYRAESQTPNVEGLIKLLAILDESDRECQNKSPGSISPIWRTLRTAYDLNADSVFKGYSDRLIIDADETHKNSDPITDKNCEHDPSSENNETKNSQGYQFKRAQITGKGPGFGVLAALASTWDVMGVDTKEEVISVVKSIVPNERAEIIVEGFGSLMKKSGAKSVTVGLASMLIYGQCWQKLKRWFYGEISGKGFAKCCVESGLKIGSGVCGGVVGGRVGSMIAPGGGTFIGGIVGGVTVGIMAEIHADILARWMFSLPREEIVTGGDCQYDGRHNAGRNGENKEYPRCFQTECGKEESEQGCPRVIVARFFSS